MYTHTQVNYIYIYFSYNKDVGGSLLLIFCPFYLIMTLKKNLCFYMNSEMKRINKLWVFVTVSAKNDDFHQHPFQILSKINIYDVLPNRLYYNIVIVYTYK